MGRGSPILGLCMCDGFWFLWVLVWRDGSASGFAGCFCGGWVVVGCDFGGWLWLCFGFFLFLFFLQGVAAMVGGYGGCEMGGWIWQTAVLGCERETQRTESQRKRLEK